MKPRSLALLVVGGLAVAGAGQVRPVLLERRTAELGSVAPEAPPPDVAVAGVFLGAFRGLVVDYLWLRTQRLEDEGKFFEALDLADWITRLEPRLEQVWSFKAHALAYNASVATDDRRQRWQWIQNGAHLLRDRGIPINPRAPELYFMLSRIYSDRIGQPYDDHQLYLKERVAREMARGFGPPGAEVPLEDLAAAPPEPSGLSADAGALLRELEKRSPPLDKAADAGLLDTVLGATPGPVDVWTKAPPEVRRAVEAFLRARWLRETAKLDPKLVLELDRAYGPLDWRGCDAQALYWAARGARAARLLGPERAGHEERRLERLAISAVKNAMRRGRLVVEPDGTVFFAPLPRLATRVIQLYDDAIERARAAEARGEGALAREADEDDDGHHHESPQADATVGAYRNSLEDAEKDFFVEAIMVLAQYGRESESRKVYATFAQRHPDLAGRGYDEFTTATLRFEVLGGEESGASLVQTQQLLLGTWTRAWTALALGDDDRALGLATLADRVQREWMKIVAAKAVEGNNDVHAAERLGSASLGRVKERAYEDVRARLAPALRARLEERAQALSPARGEGER